MILGVVLPVMNFDQLVEPQLKANPRLGLVVYRETLSDVTELPLWILNSQSGVVWMNVDRSVQLLGLGEACRFLGESLQDLNEAEALVSDHPARDDINIFFGARFRRSSTKGEEWREFPEAEALIPAITIEIVNNQAALIVSVPAEGSTEELKDKVLQLRSRAFGYLKEDAKTKKAVPGARFFGHLPSSNDYNQRMDTLLQALRSHQLEKAVVGRRTDFIVEKAISIDSLLSEMMSYQTAGYVYCWKQQESVFCGISPETLLRMEGGKFECDALGGTLWDQGESYGWDDKLLFEHESVRKDIVQRLSEDLTEISVSAPETVKLNGIAHLRSRIKGCASRKNVSFLGVVDKLHPTAAVCGYPESSAHQMIEDFEPFDRGWYAGPIGVLRAESCEAAVALRCILMRRDSIHAYAAGGIIEASDKEVEWEELNQKVGMVASVLQAKLPQIVFEDTRSEFG